MIREPQARDRVSRRYNGMPSPYSTEPILHIT